MKEEILNYIPSYILEPPQVKAGKFKKIFINFVLLFFRIIFLVRVRFIGKRKELKDANEKIRAIYNKEAKNYEWKHHQAANYRDTWWRRQVGFDAVLALKNGVLLLDIGTGIGLSLEEMLRVFKIMDVKVKAFGLDYSEEMIKKAENIVLPRLKKEELYKEGLREVKFLKGDARKLTAFFSLNYFDCITSLLGIGGIDKPMEAFQEGLKVLKPGGYFIMSDMHRPIFSRPTQWPLFGLWIETPYLEKIIWEKITLPLVLRKLWGWQDPTILFYLLPLVTYYDEKENKYYGFEKMSFQINNEVWWYRLPVPVMPTAKIIVKKEEISVEEAKKREKILKAVTYGY